MQHILDSKIIQADRLLGITSTGSCIYETILCHEIFIVTILH